MAMTVTEQMPLADVKSKDDAMRLVTVLGSARTRDTGHMVDDTARDRAIYHALKAADEVAAALQTHLIEEHGADPERAAPQSPSTNSLKLLRQARERLGLGLRSVQADHIAESDEISLRNR
jgi:cytoskeletal protein RodZ